MAGVAPPKTVGVPTSTTQHLQGLLVRKTATAEPKSLAQYFNHVADAVRANDELSALRASQLKRRAQVAAGGYEAVLNRKKRSAVHVSRPSVTGPAYLTRAAPVAAAATQAAAQAAAATQAAATAQAAAQATAAQAARAASGTTASATPTASTAAAPTPNDTKTHPNPAAMAAAAAAAAAVSARAAAAAKAAARPVAPVAVAPAKPTLLVQPAAPKPTSVPIQPMQSVGLRPAPATMATASAPIASAAVPTQLMPASLASVKPAPLHVPQSVMTTAQPIPMPASLAQTTQPLQPQPLPQQPVAVAQALPRRSDFVVGTRVMIRHTADLVACGARNLVGKTGRIVAVPQVYGQEVYSVYIDEHETMFQVPFNALVLISPPAPTPMPINMQHQPPPRSMHQLAPGGMISQAQPQVQPSPVVSAVMQPTAAVTTAAHAMRPTPSIEDIKLEHSYQLHRLMQQQYREIQVLQQQYAECRLVNPAALPSIQKELSKLRLVHLSQVQTLKSKQALDLLGK